MTIISGSINYSPSGRKRKVLQKRTNKVSRRADMSSTPFRRDSKQYPSADMASVRHDITGLESVDRRTLSSKYTIAPAYNKGAYQVISRDNVKDIGR